MTTQPKAEHPCDACGGSGKDLSTLCGELHGAKPRFGCYQCEGPGGRCQFAAQCPVCLGAGRISDRMPVSDALADAETLRPLLNLGYRHPLNTRWRVQISGPTQSETAKARLVGLDAMNAARAAFRAVPGLRGEQ